MKKWLLRILQLTAALAIVVGIDTAVLAATPPKIEVSITSPDHVKGYPGLEQNVKVNVTNHTDQTVDHVMAYITMADLTKHWTVNLEDFSADQPVVIGSLKPQETKEVTLPIRFVYTNNYALYVTAMSSDDSAVYSSSSIPVEILGNTKVNTTYVQIVSIGEPLLLLGGLCGTLLFKKNGKKRTS